MSTKSHKRGKFLAWVPAAMVLAVTVATVAGISLIPTAGALPSASVNVTGTVTGTIDFTADCGPTLVGGGGPAGSFPANFTSGGAGQISSDCTMSYTTNNITGGVIAVKDFDAGPFFCTTGCAVASSTAFENAAAGPVALGADSFGFTLKSKTADATTNINAADAAPALTTAEWYPVLPADTSICHTLVNNTADTSCTIVFGGKPGTPQNSGAYSGTAVFTATTNP